MAELVEATQRTKLIGTSHTADEIGAVVAKQACARPVREVILHHTWRPTAAQYHGLETVEGIYNYHTRELGWRDIGYHYLVGPDGKVWLGRPLGEVGAHVAGHNVGTVGASMILNGDAELPSPGQVRATKAVLRALLDRFKIDPAVNFGPRSGFHRDYSSKTCPGTLITKAVVLGWFTRADPFGESPTAAAPDGPDVAEWAAAAVERVKAAGIMTGRGGDRFDGYEPVTRQELAVVVDRLLARPHEPA